MTVTQKLELRRLDLMCWASFSSPLPGKIKEPLLTGWYCLHILIQFSVPLQKYIFYNIRQGNNHTFFPLPVFFFPHLSSLSFPVVLFPLSPSFPLSLSLFSPFLLAFLVFPGHAFFWLLAFPFP